MAPFRKPYWKHRADGLELRIGDRIDQVPAPIDQWLIGPDGLGLSADPALDLLLLESRLRADLAGLVGAAEEAERAVAAARADTTRAASASGKRRAQRRRAAAAAGLSEVMSAHDATAEKLEDAQALVEVLRGWVIQLDAPEGLLREAADGWRRSPDLPASAVAFVDDEAFLNADPRRATDTAWGRGIASIEQFGHGWRRDGDDYDPFTDGLNRAGPWSLGYIERTGEVYAARRCSYLSRAVWLLGAGLAQQQAIELLDGLVPRMREPNSLILAAGALHAARTLRTTRECVPLRRPPTTEMPPGRDVSRDLAPSSNIDTDDERQSDGTSVNGPSRNGPGARP